MKGATCPVVCGQHEAGVSTHAPVKGATMLKSRLSLPYSVSTHAPVKGATEAIEGGEDYKSVSTHAPVKGATGRQLRGRPSHPVSTHAPVKGATISIGPVVVSDVVSTHAPVKGATVRALSLSDNQSVSTHAPVKGATAKYGIKQQPLEMIWWKGHLAFHSKAFETQVKAPKQVRIYQPAHGHLLFAPTKLTEKESPLDHKTTSAQAFRFSQNSCFRGYKTSSYLSRYR